VPIRTKIECPKCEADLVVKRGGVCPNCGAPITEHVARMRLREKRIEQTETLFKGLARAFPVGILSTGVDASVVS
jgi:predicted amidophosphoribosyltransferase